MTVIWTYLFCSQKFPISNPWSEKNLFVPKWKHLVCKDYTIFFKILWVQCNMNIHIKSAKKAHEPSDTLQLISLTQQVKISSFSHTLDKTFLLPIKKAHLCFCFGFFWWLPRLNSKLVVSQGDTHLEQLQLWPAGCTSKEGQLWISQWSSSGQSKVPVVLDMHGTMLVW